MIHYFSYKDFQLFDYKSGSLFHVRPVHICQAPCCLKLWNSESLVWNTPHGSQLSYSITSVELHLPSLRYVSSHSHKCSVQEKCSWEFHCLIELISCAISRTSTWRWSALRGFNNPNAKGCWSGSELKSKSILHKHELIDFLLFQGSCRANCKWVHVSLLDHCWTDSQGLSDNYTKPSRGFGQEGICLLPFRVLG